MNQQKIGKFIQEKRKEKELSQLGLAEKLGVSNRIVLIYLAPDGVMSETKYGITFSNGQEEYFNHDNSFEIISSISRRQSRGIYSFML